MCQGDGTVALGGLDVSIGQVLHAQATRSAISSAPRGTANSRSGGSK
jgi:hypothetical protein